jgi:hypothetical protein
MLLSERARALLYHRWEPALFHELRKEQSRREGTMETVRPRTCTSVLYLLVPIVVRLMINLDTLPQKMASTGVWNHAGNGLVTAQHQESSIRVLEYPSLNLFKSSAAHVGGVSALAMDPRGR